ncbi:MAG: hypothetical protein FJX36_07345 [Alphaproteobacteria bacterium]|nr:hypothetical protein [Alphaproteobacteria bacterium]
MSPLIVAWLVVAIFIALVLATGAFVRRMAAWRGEQRLALGFQRARADRLTGMSGRPFDTNGR